MPSATHVLLDEHRRIRAVLQPALSTLPGLETGSREALAKSIGALEAWAQCSAGGLITHATKEDEILFPAVERYLGSMQGPTLVMRREHQEIHALADRFVETMSEIRQRDHPSLQAGAASFSDALGGVEGGKGSVADVVDALRDLEVILAGHFEKEERVLFPLVESILPSELQQELGEQLAAFPQPV